MTKEINNILVAILIVLLVVNTAISWSRHTSQIELNGSIKILNAMLERSK